MRAARAKGLATGMGMDDDKFHDECGVFGVFGHDDAAALTALGLHALQHRGQGAAGVVSYDGARFHSHRAIGLVADNFGAESVIERLAGACAIGHTRYATAGAATMRNVQPLFVDFAFGGCAMAHNGNLTNAYTLRRELVRSGALFQSTSDTEVIAHLIANSAAGAIPERWADALGTARGAYSIAALSEGMLIGARDPNGVRPLQLGRLDGAWILTSESCALDIIGARFERDVAAGEMVVITKDGVQSLRPFPPAPRRMCIFEYVYFARPDGALDGRNVYEARRRIGVELAREHPAPADLVAPAPDSGVPAAIGYAAESNLRFDLGIIRNHYVGRTFIEPTERIRHFGVRLKYNANRGVLEGKRVALVDDSIVRGVTARKIVEMVRRAGAAEVHLRIASPRTAHPCFYGIDTPDQEQLLAHNHDAEAMRQEIGADSLAFVSIDGLYRAMGARRRDGDNRAFCDACFSGDYPIALTDRDGEEMGANVSYLAEAR